MTSVFGAGVRRPCREFRARVLDSIRIGPGGWPVKTDHEERQSLRRQIRFWRLVYDGVWAGLAYKLIVWLSIVCLITGDIEWLWSGLFFGALAVSGLIHNHFFLLPANADPLDVKEKLTERAVKMGLVEPWWKGGKPRFCLCLRKECSPRDQVLSNTTRPT